MGYSFEYKPEANKEKTHKEHSKRNLDKNKMLIVTLIVLAGLLFVGALVSVSGYVTYKESMNKQLEYTVQELGQAVNEKDQCNANLFSVVEKENQCKSQLSTKDGQLSSCQTQKTELQNEKEEIGSSLAVCSSEKSELQSNYNTVKEQLDSNSVKYDQLAKNSVRSVCCSISDIINGNTKYWNLNDNKIDCTESGRTVNCGSGETDF